MEAVMIDFQMQLFIIIIIYGLILWDLESKVKRMQIKMLDFILDGKVKVNKHGKR